MIIIVLVALLFTVLILPISLPQQLEKARIKQEEKGLSPDEISRAMEIGEKFGKIAGPIFAVIGSILYLLALSGIFMFIGNFVLGGQTTYPKILSVISYTSLIGSLNSLLLLPMILTKKTILMKRTNVWSSLFNKDNGGKDPEEEGAQGLEQGEIEQGVRQDAQEGGENARQMMDSLLFFPGRSQFLPAVNKKDREEEDECGKSHNARFGGDLEELVVNIDRGNALAVIQ